MEDFKALVAGCDITHDELTRLRVSLTCSRILTGVERHEISQCLGVLRDILADARNKEGGE